MIFAVAIFSVFAVAALAHPDFAWTAAFAHGATTMAIVLQWCHHGVRTKQIKEYLLELNPDQGGWERWLPSRRPRTILGSRWLISTKGVLLGLEIASMLLAELLKAPRGSFSLLLGAGLLLANAAFLFTNPKE
ncbi:hypothetical protein So717_03770 [Roseobacter cerasinus]|uniref:Uncharacterized protein n=2 Tax=Roseobacter cerasinus TaxID=2602289 RepID=A0A640VLX5_9RHOB|nr:hypothetical protein So717_03770 [Roseobacter cerasinus]